MKNKLNIQWFIEQHSDWEKILSEKPYCLHIVKDNFNGKNLVMFKYNQIESDMSLPIVQECRGLILDFDTNEIVSFPFKKFFNAGEVNAAEIDWSSCWVGEKIDGSITKVVKIGDKLLWSTNGVPNAFNAPIAEQIGCTAKSFGDLMLIGLKNAFDEYLKKALDNHWCIDKWFDSPEEWFKSLLQEGYTYIFELTSPFSKVVVQFHDTKLNFLGCRNNETFEETYFTDHSLKNYFNTLKVFPLTSLDECKKATETMGPDQEGFVVCDKNFNRVKVKSILYVSLAHMRNNGVLSYERGIEIVRGNELDEVLNYFPEFKEHLLQIKEKYDKFYNDILFLESELKIWLAGQGFDLQPWLVETGGKNRKDLAKWAYANTKHTGFVFAYVDHKCSSADEWIAAYPAKNLCSVFGYKD